MLCLVVVGMFGSLVRCVLGIWLKCDGQFGHCSRVIGAGDPVNDSFLLVVCLCFIGLRWLAILLEFCGCCGSLFSASWSVVSWM